MLSNSAPAGMFLWDPWFRMVGDKIHMFFLQSPRNNDPDGRHHNKVSIGHAVSSDLKIWQMLTAALLPQTSEVSLWTGDVFSHNGTHYLFFTTRSPDAFFVQRIGVAMTQDSRLERWQRFNGNPILVADNKYYAMSNERNKLGVVPAFRDPYIYTEPHQPFFVLFCARAHGQGSEYNGCIGIAESRDLLEWPLPLSPPILAPGRYDEMEVPQLVKHHDRYYLFFSAAAKYYEPSWAKEVGTPGHGLHCYSSYEIHGPYEPVNGTGIVLNNPNLLGLRLIRQNPEGGYDALGWINSDDTGAFVGRLSDLKRIVINGDEVKVL
jgi:beta-fructofuranosidase